MVEGACGVWGVGCHRVVAACVACWCGVWASCECTNVERTKKKKKKKRG